MKLRINNSEYEWGLRKWKQWVPFKYVGGEIRGDAYCKERWPPRCGAHACVSSTLWIHLGQSFCTGTVTSGCTLGNGYDSPF